MTNEAWIDWNKRIAALDRKAECYLRMLDTIESHTTGQHDYEIAVLIFEDALVEAQSHTEDV